MTRNFCCCLISKSCPNLSDPMDCSMPGFSVHHSLWVCSNSCPLSQWCHPAISSSVDSFSFCLQSFPASVSFPMSWVFTSSGQSIGASASAPILPMNIQGWCPLGFTDLISLLSRGEPRFLGSGYFSSQQTPVLCIGRQILSHWTTSEALLFLLLI